MVSQFDTVALTGRLNTPDVTRSLLQLASHLHGLGLRVILDQEILAEPVDTPATVLPRHLIAAEADVIVVFGGDGTFLSIARYVAEFRIPLIGVNQGRLGFVTDIPHQAMLSKVEEVLRGHYVPEDRTLLHTTLTRDGRPQGLGLSLNDVVLSRGGLGQMIEFEIFIDNQFVYSQRSDGLIIATPTGSTAYALASGGPIVHPTVPAITLVPICPQSMSNRPIVINEHSLVRVLLTRGQDARVHCDGHATYDLKEGDSLVISRFEAQLRLLHPTDFDYYQTLREKLHWGRRIV